MRRRTALLTATLLIAMVGCDNRTVDPDDPLRIRGSFYALQTVDETVTPTATGDTILATLAGPDANEQAGVRLNGRLIRAQSVLPGAILYGTASEPIEPSGRLDVEVVTPRASALNSISVPAAAPVLSEPRSDVVYPRSEPLPVSWTPLAGDTATLYLRLEIGPRIWESSADWSAGRTTIPEDAWVAIRDSVGTLWASRVTYEEGRGFEYRFSMAAELARARKVRVTPFETPDN